MATNEVWILETAASCGIPSPDTIYWFDETVGGAWYKHTGMSVMRMLSLDPAIDDKILLGGSATNAYVYRLLNGSSDLGSPILGRWQTPWHDAGEPDTVKVWRSFVLHVDQLPRPVTIGWEIDGDTLSGQAEGGFAPTYVWNNAAGTANRFVWNNAAGDAANGLFWEGGQADTRLSVSLPQLVGRRIRFTLYESGSFGAFRIMGYDIEFRPRRGRYPTLGTQE